MMNTRTTLLLLMFSSAPAFAQGTPLLNPNNGHYYQVIDGVLGWNDASTTAQATLWQGSPGYLATITSQAEMDWILNNIAPSRPWIGLFQNTASPTYSEPSGGWEWVTGEPFVFNNWAPGEPNNISGSGGAEDYAELFANGQMNDAEEFHVFTTQYLVEWEGGVGTTYCSPAAVNTTGMSATMAAGGSATVASNNLVLSASAMPLNQFGIFITSPTQGFVPMPGGSQGNLCLAGNIGRYNGPGQILNSGSMGSFSLAVNLTATPTPSGPVSVMAGETRHFQAWYRDLIPGMGATSNFTNGLSITFN